MFFVFLLFALLAGSGGDQRKLEFKSGDMSSVYEESSSEFVFDGDMDTRAHSICNKEGNEIWMKLVLFKESMVIGLTVWPTHLYNINWSKRFGGTKIYVGPEGAERYCGTVTIPTEADQTSSDIICESPILGKEVVFRQQKESGEAACIHVFEVEAYGYSLRK